MKAEYKMEAKKDKDGKTIVGKDGKTVRVNQKVRYNLSHFPFNVLTDSPQGVAIEMAKEIPEVTEHFIPLITEDLIKLKNDYAGNAVQ